MSLAHWDEHPGADLAREVGAEWACLRRLTIGPGDPLHLDAPERETVAWVLDREVALVRRPGDLERSLRAEGPTHVLVLAARAPAAGPVDGHDPAVVVRVSDLPPEHVRDGPTAITRRDVGSPAGAVRVAVELVEIEPHACSLPVADQGELSVVLAGDGRAILADGEHPVRRGCVVGRAERFAADADGLRLLSFRERPVR